MNDKHGHVEKHRYANQAQGPRREMARKQRHRHAEVAQQRPELDDGQDANRGDREEADPFAADDCSESEAGQREPDPPATAEGADSAGSIPRDRVLVREADPEEDGEGGEEDEGRVEEDEARLGDEPVLEHDEEGAEEGGRGASFEGAESEVRKGDEGETESRGEEAHGDVGDLVGSVLATDLLEVERAALEARDPGHEGEEEFGEGRVDVHEEPREDVPACAGLAWPQPGVLFRDDALVGKAARVDTLASGPP